MEHDTNAFYRVHVSRNWLYHVWYPIGSRLTSTLRPSARKSGNLGECCKIRLVGYRPKMYDNSRLRSNFLDSILDTDFQQNLGFFEFFWWWLSKMYARVAAKTKNAPFWAKIEKSSITQNSCRIILFWLYFRNLHKIWGLWVCSMYVLTKNKASYSSKCVIFDYRIFAKSGKNDFEPLVRSATSISGAQTLFSGVTSYCLLYTSPSPRD